MTRALSGAREGGGGGMHKGGMGEGLESGSKTDQTHRWADFQVGLLCALVSQLAPELSLAVSGAKARVSPCSRERPVAAWLLDLQQRFPLLGWSGGLLSLTRSAFGFSSEAAGYQEEGGKL